MNIEKFKPWNWFKHENSNSGRVPVNRLDSTNKRGITTRDKALIDTNGLTPGLQSLAQLHKEMDRLFDDAWNTAGFGLKNSFENSLAQAQLDIAASDTEYQIQVNVPGFKKDDLNLEVVGNMLKISGVQEEASESKDQHYYCMERTQGSFHRTLALPDDALANDIIANVKDGVLEIRVPRNEIEQEQVRRISIS